LRLFGNVKKLRKPPKLGVFLNFNPFPFLKRINGLPLELAFGKPMEIILSPKSFLFGNYQTPKKP